VAQRRVRQIDPEKLEGIVQLVKRGDLESPSAKIV
jgi:hypothetical protein